MGANSALLITVPDIARYAKSPNGQLYGQLISLPIAQTLVGMVPGTAAVSDRILRSAPPSES